MTDYVISHDMRTAEYYAKAFTSNSQSGTMTGISVEQGIHRILGLKEGDRVIVVNADNGKFSLEALRAIRAQEANGVDVTWFGFGYAF